VTAWKLFDGDIPYVSTAEFHAGRDRAPHLEQPGHRERLLLAASMLQDIASPALTFSDLGCGDGGLLSLVQDAFGDAWGYDFCPANAAGWTERGVTATSLDVFGADRDRVRLGDVTAMTEVLEHVADPPAVLAWVRGTSRWLACSSPQNEDDCQHAPEHAWAWDMPGYADLITAAGWVILRHEQAGPYQLILASRG
jgi:Methyltransferase domain